MQTVLLARGAELRVAPSSYQPCAGSGVPGGTPSAGSKSICPTTHTRDAPAFPALQPITGSSRLPALMISTQLAAASSA